MEADVKEILAEQFRALPKVVQNAITSSNVEQKMQEVAKKHSLHLDQWIPLENEVMMTLLGIQPIDKLAANIVQETGTSKEIAEAIAEDASLLIFEPIREELERELHKPDAQINEAESSDAPHSSLNTPSSVRTTIEGDPYREALK